MRLRSGLIIALLLCVGGGAAYRQYVTPQGLPGREVIVYLPAKAAAADEMVRQGLLDPLTARALIWWARTGAPVRSGEYRFVLPVSPQKILSDLRAGRVMRRKITLIEGTTAARALATLEADPYLTGELPSVPEGSLLPETYVFERGDRRDSIVAAAAAARNRLLDRLWQNKAEGLPLRSKEEAVILASIVEKETAAADERPRIAAVFLNRLRRGMRLQSDPTALYNVAPPYNTAAEVRRETPYNTYFIQGLPPGPIALPGEAALRAVLQPDTDRNSLYFVADGTGGHVFAATYEEHRRNVEALRRRQRSATP